MICSYENETEQSYAQFELKFREELTVDQVDYFGINITSDPAGKTLCKIYFKENFSRSESHPLIEYLMESDMIRFMTMVHDQQNVSRLRFDIGLKNRNNENMENLYEWLRKYSSIFSENEDEIRRQARMKMTFQPGFDEASLYFLGFISTNDRINLLKVHYFTRMCSDPDILHKYCHYMDDYYLSYLEELQIPEFRILSEIMRQVLDVCGGHLWMTGADYDLAGASKYKIYIKKPEDLYEGLQKTFGSSDCEEKLPEFSRKFETLKRRTEDTSLWNSYHKEYDCDGFALCMNRTGNLSVNFYYKLRGNRE